MSSGSRQQVHYAPETVAGTLPSPFNRELLRFTSFALDGTMGETESEEIVDSPLSSGSFKTSVQYQGDLAGELSYATYDKLFAALFRNEWVPVDAQDATKGDSLVLGAIKKTFSFLRGYLDSGGYHIFKGVQVVSMTLDVPEEGIITVTFGLGGEGREPVTFTLPAGTVTPANTNVQMTNVGTGDVTIDGQSLANVACVSAFSLTMEWTTQSQTCFGKGLSAGKLLATAVNITGSVTMAWGDEAASFNEMKYTNSSISIVLPISDEEGNTYIINVPEATVAGDLPSGARGDLLQYQLNFTCRRQSPTLTRKPA